MLRYIKITFLLVLAALLLSIALANRSEVTLNLLTPDLAGLIGVAPADFSVTLPLFAVVLGGVATGILVGFIVEWLREHKHRAEARTRTREAKTLAREVVRLKDKQNEGKDEILALVDDGPRQAS